MEEEKGKILNTLKLKKLFENLTGYIEVQVEIAKLDLKEQAENTTVNVIQAVVILMFLIVCLLFISIAGSILINYLTESNFIGYLTVSLLYLALVIVLMSDKKKRFAKWIFKRFSR